MNASRFRPGNMVEFVPTRRHGDLGSFTIVRELPDEVGEPRYRVRSTADGRERVAAEHELAAVQLVDESPLARKRGR
jgi:hypothetical protein